MRTIVVFLIPLLGLLSVGQTAHPMGLARAGAQQTLTIFNAGSLTPAISDLVREYAKRHPGVQPQAESSGSLDAARKITELGRPCDLIVVADYEVIPSLLMPQYANWFAIFARNQMVVMYTPESKLANQINSNNWYDILLRPGVRSGHSNPDADPAGYRTLLVWQLAEKYYHQPRLSQELQSRVPPQNIRPRSVELVALLQAGELDYVYGYRSVAEQNALRFVTLPREIDLSDPAEADLYATVSVEVAGKKPGDKVTMKGLPILLGLTIPKAAPQAKLAEDFVRFMLSPEGQEIMRRRHVVVISPPQASPWANIPPGLVTLFVNLQWDASAKR